jgi:hypothetical protein
MKSTLNIAAFLIIVSAAQADWVAQGPPPGRAAELGIENGTRWGLTPCV